jgi:hypothetical protein
MLVRPQRKMKKITPVFQHISHHNDWFLFLLSEEHKVFGEAYHARPWSIFAPFGRCRCGTFDVTKSILL